MGNVQKKKSKSWLALLAIPVQIIIDIIAFIVAAWMDIEVIPDPNALGHPAPVMTILIPILFSGITAVVVIVAIIIFIVGLVRTSNYNKKLEQQNSR